TQRAAAGVEPLHHVEHAHRPLDVRAGAERLAVLGHRRADLGRLGGRQALQLGVFAEAGVLGGPPIEQPAPRAGLAGAQELLHRALRAPLPENRRAALAARLPVALAALRRGLLLLGGAGAERARAEPHARGEPQQVGLGAALPRLIEV